MRGKRAGFTLIELLVVMAIILLVSAVAFPTISSLTVDHRLTGAASEAQGALVMARNKAFGKGASGFRLVPDPAWPLMRLADGTLDPSYPLAYSRIVSLELPQPYHSGFAEVHTDGFPASFVPLPNRLVLEESLWDNSDPLTGVRVEPTGWWWNVRVGEIVTFQGREYTVTGPLVVGWDENPEGFVNVGLPGALSPLDRGDGPREYLYLCNRRDDPTFVQPDPSLPPQKIPPDGQVDAGWNGQDDDLDGLIDENDEWETEAWGPIPPPWVKQTVDGPITFMTPAPYSLARRPVASSSGSVELASGAVIDATGWGLAGFQTVDADGNPDFKDRRVRSQLPLNPYTGAVDVIFEDSGRVEFPTWYGRPWAGTLGRPFVHLWIAERTDVQSPVLTKGDARLVSLDRLTGRVVATTADATDPAAAFAHVEHGSR